MKNIVLVAVSQRLQYLTHVVAVGMKQVGKIAGLTLDVLHYNGRADDVVKSKAVQGDYAYAYPNTNPRTALIISSLSCRLDLPYDHLAVDKSRISTPHYLKANVQSFHAARRCETKTGKRKRQSLKHHQDSGFK